MTIIAVTVGGFAAGALIGLAALYVAIERCRRPMGNWMVKRRLTGRDYKVLATVYGFDDVDKFRLFVKRTAAFTANRQALSR